MSFRTLTIGFDFDKVIHAADLETLKAIERTLGFTYLISSHNGVSATKILECENYCRDRIKKIEAGKITVPESYREAVK